jgi:hypothetical protein
VLPESPLDPTTIARPSPTTRSNDITMKCSVPSGEIARSTSELPTAPSASPPTSTELHDAPPSVLRQSVG